MTKTEESTLEGFVKEFPALVEIKERLSFMMGFREAFKLISSSDVVKPDYKDFLKSEIEIVEAKVESIMTDKELNQCITKLQDLVTASGKMGDSLGELQTRVNEIKKHLALLSSAGVVSADFEKGVVISRKKEIDETLINWIEDKV